MREPDAAPFQYAPPFLPLHLTFAGVRRIHGRELRDEAPHCGVEIQRRLGRAPDYDSPCIRHMLEQGAQCGRPRSGGRGLRRPARLLSLTNEVGQRFPLLCLAIRPRNEGVSQESSSIGAERGVTPDALLYEGTQLVRHLVGLVEFRQRRSRDFL